jgi:hypothetical protein
VARARLIVPLAVVCALAAAAPAFALPHVSKSQNRMISNLVERWVNDVVRGRNLADGWKIAGAAERGGIKHKAWLSGKELPLQQMDVLNNPRKAWYVTGKSGNEIFLTVSLMTGHGKNKTMYDNETTLQKVHGRWYVYTFYTDGIFRLGRGHSGSCVSSKCKVTGLTDFQPGGGVSSGIGSGSARIGTSWAFVVFGGLLGLPLLALLVFGVISLVRSRQARLAYTSSRTSS